MAGAVATVVFYVGLVVIQIANADMACETYPKTVPDAESRDVRGIGFENSWLNLGGRCTYYMSDGLVVRTREPGGSFSGTLAGFVAMCAGVAVLVVRRKGHSGWLYGFVTFVAPPLGLDWALVAPRRRLIGAP